MHFTDYKYILKWVFFFPSNKIIFYYQKVKWNVSLSLSAFSAASPDTPIPSPPQGPAPEMYKHFPQPLCPPASPSPPSQTGPWLLPVLCQSIWHGTSLFGLYLSSQSFITFVKAGSELRLRPWVFSLWLLVGTHQQLRPAMCSTFTLMCQFWIKQSDLNTTAGRVTCIFIYLNLIYWFSIQYSLTQF